MKIHKIIITTALLFANVIAKSQDIIDPMTNYWQIGIGLGELPIGGSLKPSVTFGYHFNDKLYTGIIYQFKDEISRNGTSFNAQSSGIDGLMKSSETVAERFMLQVRYSPIKYGPYLSSGLVYNGEDAETMIFDERSRNINNEPYNGTLEIKQTRPAGWGLALGIGYQYNFKKGFSAGFEWTPAWWQYPTPSYQFSGTSDLSISSKNELQNRMDKGFKSSPTNMYKVFHIGLAYRWQ